MCIKRGKFNLAYFKISNGLSQDLVMCKSGCYINEHGMNHVMYADDNCLLVPSAINLHGCWMCVLTLA